MKRTNDCSDLTAGVPSGLMPESDLAMTVSTVSTSPAELLSPTVPLLGAVPVPPSEPPSLSELRSPAASVPPAELLPAASPAVPLLGGGSVLSVLCGAREVVAEASRVSLCGESSETLNQVIAATARLRSVTQALLLGATAALEAKRAGSGRTALRDQARLGSRNAKRTAEVSAQFARMPNVARGLSVGDLTPEHVEVLADAARRTSPEAVDTAVELLEAAAQVAPEVLRRDAQDFAARHDPDSVRTVLDRQRRERSAALFIDERTGMGVLNAKFDPVSFALVQQAVENYNDALWRLDGGRDGTPRQVRDNRQRLADSVFEMLTDRNALATIEHPAAQTPNTAPDHTSNADHDILSITGHRHHGDAEPDRGDDRAGPARGSGAVVERPVGRSIERWRAAQAPNQLIIVAEIGVIDGTKPDGRCDMLGAGPVPPSILNQLSPDTRISGALFNTAGQPLWLGRSRRLASVAQRLAIAIRDRGCVLCRAPMHRCNDHHIDEWQADNGGLRLTSRDRF